MKAVFCNHTKFQSNKNIVFMFFVWIVHLKPWFCIMHALFSHGGHCLMALVIRLDVKMTIPLQTKASLKCVYSPAVTMKHIAQRTLIWCTLCTFNRAIPVVKYYLYSFMRVPSDSYYRGTICNATATIVYATQPAIEWKRFASYDATAAQHRFR